MLTTEQINELRRELATAKNPLIFHDGDGDGLASYLLLYRIHKEGKRYALTSTSILDERFMRKVNELNPDKIFILDVPVVQQEFINQAKRPIFWIDHHPPLKRTNVRYYNPRIKDPDAYIPTTRMAYQISQNNDDLWIATAGCLADWHMPDFIDDFCTQYPWYLKKKKDLPTTVFKRKVGMLVKLLFFIQKGKSSEVQKSINVLTRVKHPDEIFKQTTAQGKFLYKRFTKINKMYEELLKEAKKTVTRSKLLLFYYTENQWSFTANLANELSARYQKKYVIIARQKDDLMKCSLRGKNVGTILAKALENVAGRGGGHPDACGAVIEKKDWDVFLEQFKNAMKK